MTERGGPHRERRRHPRALTDLRATVAVGGGLHPARVINLSMGGALLDLGDASPPPAAEVGHRVALEVRCRGRAGLLRVDARVVLWSRADDRAPLLAVQFEPMNDENSDLLEELMSEALSQLRSRAFAATLPR